MKRISLLLLFFAGTIVSNAQKQIDPVKLNKVTVQQQTTNPTLALPPGKITQTASANIAPATVEGKDLQVTIDKMDDLSGNTNTFYVVHYSVINSGTVDVDISNISMQGHFNQVGTAVNYPSGGTTIISSDLGNHPVLRPGEKFQGQLNASTPQIFLNTPYKYVLTADDNNRIAEVNENNNSAEIAVQSHKQPDLVPGNIKVVRNTQTGKWDISYVLTNEGNNPIDLNYVRFQGYFVALIPYGPPIGGCGFNVSTSNSPTMLNPKESYSGSFSCTQNDLLNGKQYNYELTFFSTYPMPESNTTNNKASFSISIP